MEFHKLAGQLIFVSVFWQLVSTVPVDQAGSEQLEREDAPGRQFGGFLVEHPDFPGRPVFVQDPPDSGTIGHGPTSVLSEFGLDVSKYPSFATTPDADADAEPEAESYSEVETDEGEPSNTQSNRRREDKNKNSYQPQYRPQYRPQNRPQNRPHRPQVRPQQPAPQYNRPQYSKPPPQYEKPQPHYEKPQPQYEKPQPQYEKPQPQYEKPQPQYVHPESPEHGKQEYEAFMVKFPGYGHYIVLAEPGTVGAGHSSPFQLVHKPMGYVTLYPKKTKGVEVKVGDTEAPTTTTAAPPKRDVVRDQTLAEAMYAGVSEKDDEDAKES